MKRSLLLRIFSGYFLVIFLLAATILFFSFRVTRRQYLATLTDDLRAQGVAIAQIAAPFVEQHQAVELNAVIRTLDHRTHCRITVIDPDGGVLADSQQDPRHMENHRLRSEVMQVLRGKTGTALRYSSTLHENMLYVALPVERGGKLIAIVRTSMFLKDIDNLLAHIRSVVFRIAAVVIVFSLFIAFLLSRSITRPLAELTKAARRVAKGDFSTRVFLRTNSELNDLGKSFNYMTGQVNDLFEQLSRQKQELDAIISSLREGLFVCDAAGKIKLHNSSFDRMTGGANSADGRFYWEILRDPGFKRLMQQLKAGSANVADELELNGRIYLCSVSPLSSEGEFVAVLHDITQSRELERVKKDFISNVSHELRTPLTAIGGFIETLEETTDGENRHYLEIIGRHTTRLKAIVEDLLTLSAIEDKSYVLDVTDVDLRPVIENMAVIFEERIKKKGLTLTLDLHTQLPATVKGDRCRLEQVIVNLLDNALKYTDRGGITVSLARDTHSAVITVEDTGIGIPAEHLARIYERFYVVDKSRSRKSGGTGLGLSIVKHILLLHNGTIKVESIAGQGSRFIITIPV